MSRSRIFRWLIGFVFAGCIPLHSALAQNSETFVASSGDDTNGCFLITAPCKTFNGALQKTLAAGQITVLDTGDFGPVVIDRSISIVNNTAATATIVGTHTSIGGQIGQIIIASAGSVTLRGLTLNAAHGTTNGIVINNAANVDIHNCVILGQNGNGIVVAPNLDGLPSTFPAAFHVKIQDTAIAETLSGIRVFSVPGVPVNVDIVRSSIDNNNGPGVRADGTVGGAGSGDILVGITDSSIAFNNGNGVLALSGTANVLVHVTRTEITSNAASGVQSNQTNGGSALVTVRGSTLINNLSGAVNFFGSGALTSFGDNNVVGALGTGFSGQFALQ